MRYFLIAILAIFTISCSSNDCHITVDAKYNGTTYGATSHEFVDTTSGNTFYPNNADSFDIQVDSIYRMCLDEKLNIKRLH